VPKEKDGGEGSWTFSRTDCARSGEKRKGKNRNLRGKAGKERKKHPNAEGGLVEKSS